MTSPDIRLDDAAQAWRNFSRDTPPPSSFQRAVARFCGRYVSVALVSRLPVLRRIVTACRDWDSRDARLRSRFVRESLRAEGCRLPVRVLASVVDDMAPRQTAVDEKTIFAIYGAVGRLNPRPLPPVDRSLELPAMHVTSTASTLVQSAAPPTESPRGHGDAGVVPPVDPDDAGLMWDLIAMQVDNEILDDVEAPALDRSMLEDPVALDRFSAEVEQHVARIEGAERAVKVARSIAMN
ncbi:hypothetical protein ACT80S_02395 [Ramlibacter sp. MAHUQ-53]|uniref:hypothetical protein n=1 Tax=unclassified Ramlibacter TaxID=2617605 RepID=UPI00362C4855